MFDNLVYQGRTHPVLSGTAYVDAGHHVVRMEMDGKVQR
jgi:hypothetical protein